MPPEAYRELLAATNMKQRVRKLLEYTWADRLGYAVVGHAEPARVRPGLLRQGRRRARRREADRRPLQEPGLRAGAASSGCRRRSRTRTPTTETFSLPQTQEEFYFGHPYERMDLLLWGHAHGIAPAELAPRVGLVARTRSTAAYGEIERRRVATEYLHAPARPDRPGRLTCAASRASSARTRRHAGRGGRAPADGARDPPPRPGRLRARPRRRRRPRLDPARDRRPPERLAAARGGVRRQRARLQRRGLQPPRAARRAARARRSRSRPRATPRSSCGCSSATGSAALDRLNGQFAFAWWQPAQRRLTLVRDRFGVRPLHYALLADGTLVFGSEAKALFASGEVARRAGPRAGSTRSSRSGAPRPPRSAVRRRRARSRPAGCSSGSAARSSSERRWWAPELRRWTARGTTATSRSCCATASRLRLRADVPVGAYLSGGLDSSLISALAQAADGRRAAHVLGRLRGPALRRARPAGGGRARDRHPPPRRRGRARPRSPTRFPTSSATPRRR